MDAPCDHNQYSIGHMCVLSNSYRASDKYDPLSAHSRVPGLTGNNCGDTTKSGQAVIIMANKSLHDHI
jgi:hypothetical protein